MSNTASSPRTAVATPLSSLRRPGAGIGEYTDLVAFGQWCAEVGFDLVQILPVQDTGLDPSPYSGASAVALHPIYLDVAELVDDFTLLTDYQSEQRTLAAKVRVDYAAVLDSKSRALRQIFESLDLVALERELEAFAAEQTWVHVYAAYKILHHENEGRAWPQWSEYRDPTGPDLQTILESRRQEWLFHTWLQYHCHRQLSESSRRLAELGVGLKGDVPIMLQEDSADVWFYRDIFDLGGRAGAPPDVYCSEGQYWAFPLYDWDRMREDGYSWWKRRIHHAAQYYRALRIDHVLGFFRIWRIDPPHLTGTEGRYTPTLAVSRSDLHAAGWDDSSLAWLAHRDGPLETIPESPGEVGLRFEWELSPRLLALDEDRRPQLREILERSDADREALWARVGRERLSALCEESDMLLCAEDLGAVPQCVRPTLDALGIPGLKVERWCRAEHEPDRPFWDPAHFPQLSVCAPGLHDASSIRGWWREEDDATRALYYHRALGRHGEAPADLDGDTMAAVLRRNLRANSQLVVLMLPDCLALDEELRPREPDEERINVPGTLDPKNWSWRMPVEIEELRGRENLDERLRRLVAAR